MRDHENIMKVAASSPDFMGFIFYSKSPRYVGESFSLPSDFPSSIAKVGVFVNESKEKILAIANRLKLDLLQLHGSETVQQCGELRSHNYQIIKAFSVDNSFDFGSAKFYLGAVDFFLFDTKGQYHGGNAKAFNWSLLKSYDLELPYFLSGGLTPENVKMAIELHDPRLFALDINSGVEISPAVKDIDKIRTVKNIINHTLNHELQG